jgi:membrane protein
MGAVVAVPLWLLAKWGFGLYVEKLVARGSLYGALGLIPLFLLWLSLSWQIVLLGAQLAYTQDNLARLEQAERAQREVLVPADRIAAALAIARRFDAGEGPTPQDLLADELGLPTESVVLLGRQLESLEVASRLQDDTDAVYVLGRPPGRLSAMQLVGLDQPLRPGLSPALGAVYERLVNLARPCLGTVSVADLLAEARA